MLHFDIITIFPDIFPSYFSQSIIKRAQEEKKIKIKIHNLRQWTEDKRKTIDGRPYGGGAGMIFKLLPLYKSIKSLTRINTQKIKNNNLNKNKKQKIILLTPKGKQFDQKIAKRYSKLNRIILICGHYEGFDERITKFVDEKISIGPYVLTGGEIPAMILVDATTRLIPGVIKKKSLEEESFSKFHFSNSISRGIEYPQYTRPEAFTYKNKFGRIIKLKVPKVLLSGNHRKIKEWREKHLVIHDK